MKGSSSNPSVFRGDLFRFQPSIFQVFFLDIKNFHRSGIPFIYRIFIHPPFSCKPFLSARTVHLTSFICTLFFSFIFLCLLTVIFTFYHGKSMVSITIFHHHSGEYVLLFSKHLKQIQGFGNKSLVCKNYPAKKKSILSHQRLKRKLRKITQK